MLYLFDTVNSETYTANTQYQKFEEKKISEKDLRCHSPNSYIHVSVSDLYIPKKFLCSVGVNVLYFSHRS